MVIHLASNPDIARAMTEPAVDFDEGTLLTHHVVEAMRRTETPRLLYASGSGVYGDLGEPRSRGGPRAARPDLHLRREQARRRGADLRLQLHVRALGRVLPLRQRRRAAARRTASASTSCAGCSKTRRADDPRRRPPEQVLHPRRRRRRRRAARPHRGAERPFQRVQRRDRRLHHRHARSPISRSRPLGLDPADVRYEYTGGDRGWKGDVPVVRLNTDRIRALGWTPPPARRARR